MTKQPNSRYCFLCGRDNPIGLKMSWYHEPENNRIRGDVTVPEHFNGFPGVVHGGIVAAILDETAGRAVLIEDQDNLMVTLKLEITYRNPTPTETPLQALGWTVKQTSKRAQVEGRLETPDGTVTATCKAVVLKPPASIQENWDEERKQWTVDPD
jgi:uncharacterized protein (TIGR00369 family)